MSDGIVLKKGSGFDSRRLTAIPSDVIEGELFLGNGSNEIQTGTLKKITAINKKMSVNETYVIAPGHHDGTDRFYQEGVPVEEGPIIDPGAGGIVLNLIGKVLTSDTTIMSVENLKPSVIKYGVQVGDTTGNYQGFPDEE